MANVLIFEAYLGLKTHQIQVFNVVYICCCLYRTAYIHCSASVDCQVHFRVGEILLWSRGKARANHVWMVSVTHSTLIPPPINTNTVVPFLLYSHSSPHFDPTPFHPSFSSLPSSTHTHTHAHTHTYFFKTRVRLMLCQMTGHNVLNEVHML